MNFNLDPKILLAGAFVALISVFPFNDGFYIFTRVVVCLSALYGIFYLNKKEDSSWIIFALIAVLYNPIVPVYLHSRPLWVVINVLTSIFFFRTYYNSGKSDNPAVRSDNSDTYSIVSKILFYISRIFVLLGIIYFPLVLFFAPQYLSEYEMDDFIAVLVFTFIMYLVLPRVWNYLFFDKNNFWIPGTFDDLNNKKESKDRN